ncbi:uncharacterized protein LOC141637446 [Silene latifolia]|uniref:uncharacterized protein LOC141637446 n=1 Tax=Silene latifolia TaxID=37657 RepID=UPI003D77E083
MEACTSLRELNAARDSFLQQKPKTQWIAEGDNNTAYFLGNLLTQINATNITLIPKCETPTSVKHFRPSACCNLIYKTISKLLGLKLKHFMFGNDLLMFCKGNAQSVMLLMRAFSSFPKASGLSMNNSKYEVYFNGMEEVLRSDIKQVTGFIEGSMPFRYLGVLIQVGRLTKKECNVLTEKMVIRIRSLGAKKLSYAGRLTLINSVLNTLNNYWASMFIIPKSVIKRIERSCRNFLWDGSSEYHRVPLVAWEKVTLPKDEGGLGIKKADIWNVAAVAKLVNWIYSKSDRLWIRWINQIYIKNLDGLDYNPPTDATWSWKCICKVKE